MATNHFQFTGSAYPFSEDLLFSSNSFSQTAEDNLVGLPISYIDPSLQVSSPSDDPYLGHCDLSQQQLVFQRYLQDNQKTAFFNADIPSKMTCNRALMRPVTGIPPPPPPSHVRFASPISSPEPSSSTDSMRSPPADTDSHYESFGSPAADPVSLQLPFQQQTAYDQHWTSHANPVQFMGIGARDAFVNPNDVSPNQHPLDFCDNESTTIDFFPPQRGYSFESFTTTSQCDMEPVQTDTAALDLPVRRLASPDTIQPVVKDEINVSSQYPPPPPPQNQAAETEDSDGEPLAPAPKRRKSINDGDYKPTKKQALNTRRQTRRAPKSQQATLSATNPLRSVEPASKKVKTSQIDTTQHVPQAPAKALLASTSSGKGVYTCPDCSHSPFKDQANLDNHIKKQHTRPFTCVFHFAGCESTFASKNEWKRHVLSQHLLLNYWLCDEGSCAQSSGGGKTSSTHGSSPLQVVQSTGNNNGRSSRSSRSNTSTTTTATPGSASSTAGEQTATNKNNGGVVFNRKDLYTQHVRRMHMPPQIKKSLKQQQAQSSSSSSSNNNNNSTAHPEWEERLRALQARAIRSRCALPQMMACPAVSHCAMTFHGPDAWDQRMEHVARHLEKAAAGREPPVVFGHREDTTLVEWAGRGDVGIVRRKKKKDDDDGKSEDGWEWELNTVLRRGGQGQGQVKGGGGEQQVGIVIVPSSGGVGETRKASSARLAGIKRKAAGSVESVPMVVQVDVKMEVEEEDEVEVKNEIVVTSSEDDGGDDNEGEEIVVDSAVFGDDDDEDDDDDLQDAEGEEDD